MAKRSPSEPELPNSEKRRRLSTRSSDALVDHFASVELGLPRNVPIGPDDDDELLTAPSSPSSVCYASSSFSTSSRKSPAAYDRPSSVATAPSTPATTPRPRFPSDFKTIPCTHAGCGKTFNRPARLLAHLRSHANSRPFACPEPGCGKTYIEDKHLRAHVKGAHADQRPYPCARPGCGRAFATGTRLRRHEATHEAADPFRCVDHPPCDLAFRKKSTLQRHVRTAHLALPAYACATAGCPAAGFESPSALRRHATQEHATPRFWCHECAADPPVGFAQLALLQAHLRHAHRTCPFCDFRCAGRSADLDHHVDVRHSGRQVDARRAHPCPRSGCPKRFTRLSNLRAHERSAHDGVRFVCGETAVSSAGDLAAWDAALACSRSFSTKDKLEEHIRHIHLAVPRPVLAQGLLSSSDQCSAPTAPTDVLDELAGIAASARRVLGCDAPGCGARFIRYHDLRLHLESHQYADEFGLGNDPAFPIGEPLPAIDESLPAEEAAVPEGLAEPCWFTGSCLTLLGLEGVDDEWMRDHVEMRALIDGNDIDPSLHVEPFERRVDTLAR